MRPQTDRPHKGGKPRGRQKEQEIRWLDILVLSIGGTEWKSIFEVREKFNTLIPPHLVYRKAPQYGRRGWRCTIHSVILTHVGSCIRNSMRNGYIDRDIPIKSGLPRNIGNYHLRLTNKGMTRLKRIHRYICNDCLHQGLTRPRLLKHASCGHCHGRHLRFF